MRARVAVAAFLGLVLVTGLGSAAHGQTVESAPVTDAVGPVPAPAPADAGGGATVVARPPADSRDLAAWLDYKQRADLVALPDEARLFYRRAVIARHSGQDPEAIRLMRGAADLDPDFLEPHAQLAAWSLTRDPSQALQHVAGAIDIGRRSFLVQIGTVANAFFFAVFALFIALVAAGFMLVVVHQESLRHPWAEGFARLMSPRSAQFWSWVALALPFAVGLGIAVPTAAFLGMLWPSLRARERMLFVALVLALAAGPFLAPAMGRFSLPLRPQSAPLYDIATLHGESFDPARAERLSAAAALDPENGFLQFGLGWTARRGHDLSAAETAYGRALAAWPKSDVVLNNLGNVLFAQGRVDEAMARYREAIAANPDNAAAYFNLARIHTDRYDYRAASEALSKASSIDFDLVKSSQDHASKNGLPFMIDEWIPARAFWAATFSPATRAPDALPPSWWGRMETSGWPFTGAALALCLVALVFGVRAHATMPLRACHNCGRVVCRRCAQRRRELALCAVCAAVEARAESPEFARVLLGRERLGLQRRTRITRTTLAALIPCYGLLACRRVFRAVFLLAMIALAAAPYGGVRAPFVLNAAPEWPSGSPLDVGLWLPWVLIVALSLLGYLSASARVSSGASDPPTLVRSRPVATSRVTDMAA